MPASRAGSARVIPSNALAIACIRAAAARSGSRRARRRSSAADRSVRIVSRLPFTGLPPKVRPVPNQVRVSHHADRYESSSLTVKLNNQVVFDHDFARGKTVVIDEDVIHLPEG